MKSKKLMSLLGAVLLTVGVSLPAMADEDVIKLGVVGAHSGDLAGYGLPELNAVKLVVEDFNARGGVMGKKVVIVEQDDQCKPELATNAAAKIFAEDIKIVFGPTCSGPTKASLPLYMDKKIIVMSPSATATELTEGNKNPYFFRTTPSDDAQAQLGAKFTLDGLQAKKVAILHDKGDYGKTYADYVQQFIKQDGRAKVVFFEGITPGAMDYSSTIQKVARSGADTLVFGGYYPEASKLMAIIKKKKININFVSEDGVRTESFLELAGKDGEGVYASSSQDHSNLPITKKAAEDHRKKFNEEPGQFFNLAYAAAMALLNAVDKAQTLDPDAIAKTLRSEKIDTPLGTITFDEHGDCIGSGFAMYRDVDGVFVDQHFDVNK